MVFRIHAVQRMSERGISEQDVREILSAGESIEEYPDDIPYASPEAHETIVITVYDPDPTLWEPGFRQRRRPWNA